MKLNKQILKGLIMESLEEMQGNPYIIKTGERLENNLNAINAGNYEESDLETLVSIKAYNEFKQLNPGFDWPTPEELAMHNVNGKNYYKIGEIASILGFG